MMSTKKDQRIIIVGAGAAGLMAAYELCDYYEVTLLESRSVTGGRIRSFAIESGEILEAGPEFVHGHLPITLGLLKQAGIKFVKVSGKMYRKESGKWVNEHEMVDGWEELMEKLKEVDTDITLDVFLELYFPGDKFSALRQQAFAYAGGFDLADPSRAGVKSLYKEWSHEGESYRIPTGYKGMTDFLERCCREKGCIVAINNPVIEITHTHDGVNVTTGDGKSLHGSAAIITLPVALMRRTDEDASIRFRPAIPDYVAAYQQIGFGNVVRVVLKFSEPFWKKDTGFVFSNERFPTWWTHSPIEQNLFTGWAGGPAADGLVDNSDDEILSVALKSLSNIYNLSTDLLRTKLVSSFVFNWKNVPEAGGGYSYSTTESGEARKLLNTPIQNTVFFAGEAIYDGPYPGTVEAALHSGKVVAEAVRKAVSSS